jgi:hypothetical protein
MMRRYLFKAIPSEVEKILQENGADIDFDVDNLYANFRITAGSREEADKIKQHLINPAMWEFKYDEEAPPGA